MLPLFTLSNFVFCIVLLKIWSSSSCGRFVSLCCQLAGWNTGSANRQYLVLVPVPPAYIYPPIGVDGTGRMPRLVRKPGVALKGYLAWYLVVLPPEWFGSVYFV